MFSNFGFGPDSEPLSENEWRDASLLGLQRKKWSVCSSCFPPFIIYLDIVLSGMFCHSSQYIYALKWPSSESCTFGKKDGFFLNWQLLHLLWSGQLKSKGWNAVLLIRKLFPSDRVTFWDWDLHLKLVTGGK